MFFLAGYHASGKSYLARLLETEFGFVHVECSNVVRTMWHAAQTDLPLGKWGAHMENVHGVNYFDEAIAQKIIKARQTTLEEGKPAQEIVVTGNRSIEDLYYLADRFANTELGVQPQRIIGIQADQETLLERFRTRDKRIGDAFISEMEFVKLLKEESDRGVDHLLDVADYTLENNRDKLPEDFRTNAIGLFERELGFDRCGITQEHYIETHLDRLPQDFRDRR